MRYSKVNSLDFSPLKKWNKTKGGGSDDGPSRPILRCAHHLWQGSHSSRYHTAIHRSEIRISISGIYILVSVSVYRWNVSYLTSLYFILSTWVRFLWLHSLPENKDGCWISFSQSRQGQDANAEDVLWKPLDKGHLVILQVLIEYYGFISDLIFGH